MNYTFLPKNERAKLKTEYRVRALIVLFFVFSVANIFGIVSLFPTYINSKITESGELAKIVEINKKNTENGSDVIRKQLDQDNVVLNNAEKTSLRPEFYPLIRDIISARGIVTLNSIAVTNVSSTTMNFLVQGFSPTREGVISFKNSILSSVASSTVDLPVSALAKSKDIQFSVNITTNI